METVDHTSSRAIECASKRPSPEVLGLTMVNQNRKSGAVPSTQRKVSAVISKARKESMDPVSCRENVHARKWHGQEAIRLSICKRKRKMHLDMENFRMETKRKMKDFSAKERGNLAVETWKGIQKAVLECSSMWS